MTKQKLIPNLDNFIVLDTLAEYSYNNVPVYSDLDLFVNDVLESKIDSCIIRFTDDADIESLFEYCFCMTPHTLIVEEINRYCNVHYISPGLNKLIRYGRHKGINIIGITQRPFDVPKIIMSMIDILLIFKLQEPRDIEYMEKVTGKQMKELNTLKQGECKMFHL